MAFLATGTHGGGLVPSGSLPLPDGGRLELERFRGRQNLVLLFSGNLASPDPMARLLDELAARTAELASERAQVLTLVTNPATAQAAGRWPFPVVIDEGSRLLRRVAGGAAGAGGPDLSAAVFVTDRFREIYGRYVAPESPLPAARDVLAWLAFINMQCPECGVPEWPA